MARARKTEDSGEEQACKDCAALRDQNEALQASLDRSKELLWQFLAMLERPESAFRDFRVAQDDELHQKVRFLWTRKAVDEAKVTLDTFLKE